MTIDVAGDITWPVSNADRGEPGAFLYGGNIAQRLPDQFGLGDSASASDAGERRIDLWLEVEARLLHRCWVPPTTYIG